MHKDDAYLLDILLAARKVLKYTKGMKQGEFDGNELVQDAVMRQLEIMGEAAGRISEEYRKAHPEIPWHKIIGMRNQIIHEYFRINRQVVWDTIHNDLPDLIRLIEPLVPEE
jgi:uncharacterized protein with HEPN domain